MKKLSLKDLKNTLSRKEMKAIMGGYSRLYCTWHSLDFNGWFGYINYDKCRNM